MRTVEESNLSFVVWRLARYEEDVESRLVCREFCSYRFRSFDNPEMEDFTLYHEVVLEAYALMDLIDSIFRISGNDTVNKSAVYSTSLLEPCLEVFSEVPELDILIDALLEFLAIQEDKFAWKDDESL